MKLQMILSWCLCCLLFTLTTSNDSISPFVIGIDCDYISDIGSGRTEADLLTNTDNLERLASVSFISNSLKLNLHKNQRPTLSSNRNNTCGKSINLLGAIDDR